MKGELGPDAAADEYERELQAAGSPRFDLVLLGIGPDGHLASLFPDQASLSERSRLVVGVPEAGLEPYVPRVTLTFPALVNARQVVFLATGESKAEAVAAAFGPERQARPAYALLAAAAVGARGEGAARPGRRSAGAVGGGARVSSVIGVDLGGTKVVVACMRGRKIGESLLEATDRSASGALIDQLVALVGRIRPDDLDAVGIGVPSVVEFATGRVVSSVNIPLVDVPLRQVLGERLGVPVFVDNDATVAALAEAHDSDLRLVARNLVMLTVGTGVGGGIVLGGRIYRGATGGAGEFGHTLVGLEVERLRACRRRARLPPAGSLEYAAAGPRARPAGREAARRAIPTRRSGSCAPRASRCWEPRRWRRRDAGDPVAARIVEIWAERVGIGIANAINTFDPEEVVIGGGAARAGELLLEPARRVALGYVVPGLGRATNIRLAWHGVRAGVLGAALLAAQEVEAGAAHGTDPGGADGVAADAANIGSTAAARSNSGSATDRAS